MARPAVERQHPKKGQHDESHTCKCGEGEGTCDGAMEPLSPLCTTFNTTENQKCLSLEVFN